MATIYQRTENGTITTVSQAEGLAEINNAMMSGRHQVRTMSSITRTDYDITYKDGRSVRLVLVDVPAPEGFHEGQAVVVTRPGREPQAGTVAHIHTAPGYVAVRDDRFGSVSSYPTRFVSAVETEKQPAEETESPARPNLQTHTGVVHASGARTKALPVGRAPKCCASRSALARYHFLIPTEQAVTCRRCLAALAKEASRS
ncbi:hypothetical protein GA0115251_106926 [Streptomyces sp. TverLS-915]|uniref:hypothetical protein n=1 Tax=Streptomyces sp. TverLS-915 TaxID=1839763 RepID=UPI00081E0AE0|nr:hypothetical protein [Streptomyces sp. TverLS-915]SCD41019.1 hypothetical protein GA0115251_106926 [Streptomyces sp. TverLS-915]